mgnify:CR=1 FL=1|jgi:hypothetical protein
MLGGLARWSAGALCVASATLVLGGCSGTPAIHFTIENACDAPVSVGMRTLEDLESPSGLMHLEPGQSRDYRLLDDSLVDRVRLISVPARDPLNPSVNTKELVLDELGSGTGTEHDAYVITIEGDMCA